ncbi:MAG: response regulator [Acidobacteria bacterium]|nr:response regulator [Acidobacteriota bacterium]MBI3427241.1 response regulator [Acidobacteriota bacterium]
MSKKILIVEDNEQNLYLATYLLQNNGYEVSAARTGLEGLELARTLQPDLILMDLQLPELDGYEVTRRLKGDPATRQIPVLAVTSYAMSDDREKALAAGCAGHLEKPLAPETFASQVAKFL